MPYQRVNWQNGEAGGTPLNAENLNKMDSQINANTESIATNAAAIEQNTSDIEELKNKPAAALILTSASPLEYTIAAPILGIDVLGKSEQITDYAFNKGTVKRSSRLTTTNGTAYGSASDFIDANDYYISELIEVGENATIKRFSSSEDYKNRTAFYNASKVRIGYVDTATFTTPSGTKYIAVNGNVSELDSMTIVAIPTPTNPIPIIDASGEVEAHTKNILKPNATESVKSGVTITPIYKDNVLQYVELNGTCTSNATYYVVQGLVLNGGNYVLSGCPAGGSSSTYRLGLNDGTSTYWDIGESKSIVFDSEKTCDVRISMYSGQTYNHLRFYPMIEEGTSASSYVPYQSNTITLPTLRSIGSVADELIVNKDGSGKIVQKVGAVRFSDLTNPTFEGANSRFAFTVNNCKAQAARTLAMLCDIYTAITDGRALASVPNNSVYASGDGTKIYVHDNSTTDVSLLLGNIGDKYIYYPLATPIETPLTAEQVASILALHTYKGTTIIDAELDVKSVEYAGDIKSYISDRTDYSYEEKIVGKWGNDTLYRQVFKGISSATHTISSASIKRIYGLIDFRVVDNENISIMPIYNPETGETLIQINVVSSFDYEIVVEYTKNDTVPAISAFSIDDEAEGE